MPSVQSEFNGTPFLSIVGGKLVKKVESGTPGAKERVNKLGNTVYEVAFDAWRGIVKGWSIVDSDYGKTLHVNFDDVTLSLGGKSQSEFIKRFAGAVKDQEITVKPYDFVTDDGKRKSGLTMVQNGEKLKDFFSDYDAETHTFTYKNFYPVPPTSWDKMTEAQKKIYYITTEEFLQTFVANNPINNIGSDTNDNDIDDIISKEDTVDLNSVPF
ncbi:MAG: hypothetical protein NTW30_04890 [Candidatus Aenigmarchaeota archaeon]|nr:hypothetical protein [Candidatus Aenigmarchaeota archaeon]